MQNKISYDDESEALDKMDMVVGDNTQIDFQKFQNNDENLPFIINNVYNQPNVEYAIVKRKNYVIKNLYKKRKYLAVENGLLYKNITRSGLYNKQLVINNSCIKI